MLTYKMSPSELIEAIRAHLWAKGFDASKADVQFEQVGEKHMDGIDVQCRVVGLVPASAMEQYR